MALTVTNKTTGGSTGQDVRVIGIGDLKCLPLTIAFDNSYPTGGEPLDVSGYFDKEVINVQINPTSGYVFEYDYINKKVLAYYGNNGALVQVADATDLSSLTSVKVLAWGI